MSVTPLLAGRSVFLTGGSGSFGTAFAKRALADGARRVVIFSRDELKQAQMGAALHDDRLRFFLGDVRDAHRVTQAMQGVDTVIHAAAMKRIDACEADPDEAVKTNILGTMHVAHAAIVNGVSRAVFLSTDKAPAPHTLYGATKLCAERLWIQSNVYAAGSPTKLSATRYGNVIGSRGSVLATWREQVRQGQPLTVTSETATRFWMTMQDAVGLVVTALGEMVSGEVFIPKIGSAPILALARAVAEQGGQVYAPGHIVTGLRPGERLHETLLSGDESRTTEDRGTFYIVHPESATWRAPRVGPPLYGENRPPEGWSYRSDMNERQLSVDTLREMIA